MTEIDFGKTVTDAPSLRPNEPVLKRHRPWAAKGAKRKLKAQMRVNQVAKDDARGRPSGQGRIRSSATGTCLRAQAFSMLGIPKDPDKAQPDWQSRMLFDAGHFLHYYWQVSGLSAGWLDDIEVPCTMPITDTVSFSGSIDGVMDDGSIFEFKSVNGTRFTKALNAPFEQHVMQVHGYMLARGVTEASILYQQRDYPGSVREHRIGLDPQIADRFMREANIVARATKTNLPAPRLECIVHDTSDNTWKYCEWRNTCRPEGNSDGSPVTFD